MEYEATLNQNTANCVKQALQLTGTLYKNICDGTETFVRYGAVDFIGGFLIGSIIAATLLGIGGVFYAIYRSTR